MTSKQHGSKPPRNILVDTLIKHLKSVATEINQKIRTAAKTTWLKIKQIDPDGAKQTLETALQECESERQKKADIRKRKREQKSNPPKKQKID